jgi:uncharacterized protein (DUF1810 family)
MYEEADLFIDAQDTVWDAVISEITAGKKTSHWMWFVFPQLAILGRSDMSQLYGIHDLDEATEYLSDRVLRDRLVTISNLMLSHKGTAAADILGDVDGRKLQSSMTLFSVVDSAPEVFNQVLDVFYHGQRCGQTLDHIGA